MLGKLRASRVLLHVPRWSPCRILALQWQHRSTLADVGRQLTQHSSVQGGGSPSSSLARMLGSIASRLAVQRAVPLMRAMSSETVYRSSGGRENVLVVEMNCWDERSCTKTYLLADMLS
jgi:hypothetical protein